VAEKSGPYVVKPDSRAVVAYPDKFKASALDLDGDGGSAGVY
jgi:hypothetical protein